MTEQVKNITKKDIKTECENWARFLYKQYQKYKQEKLEENKEITE